MPGIRLPKGSLLRVFDLGSSSKFLLTEHNRQPLDVSLERIEKSHRTANGTLRKYYIDDKRTFSVTWSDIPHDTTRTVDGRWGGRDIEAWYNTHPGMFGLDIIVGDQSFTNYTVNFKDFSKVIKKRGSYDLWDLSISLEEV